MRIYVSTLLEIQLLIEPRHEDGVAPFQPFLRFNVEDVVVPVVTVVAEGFQPFLRFNHAEKIARRRCVTVSTLLEIQRLICLVLVGF